MNKRALTIQLLATIIYETFCKDHYYNEPYDSDTEYYPHRIFTDGVMIAHRGKDRSYWQLSWSIDDNENVTFSEPDTWQQVQEAWQPKEATEIGERKGRPYKKREKAGTERRTMSIRAAGADRAVEGYAFKFDVLSEDLGGFREKISKEAVNMEIVNNSDIRCLFNHDPNLILARRSYGAGSLEIEIDDIGLKYRFDVPNTTYGNDFLLNVNNGNIDQSSFGFDIADDGETWGNVDGTTIRTITLFNRFYDVSPVTYPAYPDTTVAKRNLAAATKRPLEEVNNNLEHFYKRLHNSAIIAYR